MSINSDIYNQIQNEIQEADFKAEEGLERALELSNRINSLQMSILNINEYKYEFLNNTHILPVYMRTYEDPVDLQNPKLKDLHKLLEEKVSQAQKGTLYIPLNRFLDDQKEYNRLKDYNKLKDEYINISKKLNILKDEKSTLELLNSPRLASSRYKINVLEREKNNISNEIKIYEYKLNNKLIKIRNDNRLVLPIMEVLYEKIKSENHSKGFFYRITNKDGVQSYLVGTLHRATKEMVESPALKHVIENSKHLYVENTTAVWSHRITHIFLKDPFNKSIDLALYNKAAKQNIPIDSLETLREEVSVLIGNPSFRDFVKFCKLLFTNTIQTLNSDINHFHKKMTTGTLRDRAYFLLDFALAPTKWILKKIDNVFKRKIGENLNSLKKRMELAVISDMYHAGDVSALQSIPGNQELLDNRNKKWLEDQENRKGIISSLCDTKEPLCFAFGAAHLVKGDPNILDEIISTEDLGVEKGYYDFENNEMVWKKLY